MKETRPKTTVGLGELCAATSKRRDRRLRYASENFEAQKEYPVYMTLAETLNYIAFGSLGSPKVEQDFFARWGSNMIGAVRPPRRYPLVKHLRMVIARVEWYQQHKRQKRTRPYVALHPINSIERAQVRWATLHHGGGAHRTLRDLMRDVKRLQSDQTKGIAALGRAKNSLCAALAAEKVVGFGRKGNWQHRQIEGNIAEIASIYFSDGETLLSLDGWVRSDGSSESWAEVRFKSKEICGEWPDVNGRLGRESSTTAPSNRSKAVSLPNKTGPKTGKRKKIADKMKIDFGQNPQTLEKETLDSLASHYGAAKDTVKLARIDALALIAA